jgi:GNAT superfamily N-acetyltransferase
LRNTTPEDDIEIRLLAPDDVPFSVGQTAREGWTTTADDFAIHLEHDPSGCFLASIAEEPVAIVTATRYRATGWIGNLIVVPERRGRGIGSLLMEHAMAHLRSLGADTLRLEADPPGIPIYRRLGFVDEFDSPRFHRDVSARLTAPPAAPLADADLPAVAAFDEPRFGDDRSRLLPLLLGRARLAFRVPRRGAIAGYLMALPGRHGMRIGPWVAEEPEAARDLLLAALASARSGSVTLAVPGPNTAARTIVLDAGFRETPSSLRMLCGEVRGAGRPDAVYALANGAVG